MADSMFHLMDSYYFEVPKSLWQYSFQSFDQVPRFLRDEAKEHHLKPTLQEYEEALHGKILIPQPFGELKNFYEMKSGFGISKYMVLELICALLISAIFIRVAGKVKAGGPPKGRFWNLFESLVSFVRDRIAKPAIGDHEADRFVPVLLTLFFFILGCNLLGLIPWLGSPTAAFAVTGSLAAVTLLTVFIGGIAQFGFLGFWKNQIPHMDLPWYAKPVKLLVFVIEVAGLLIKHAILAVRLLANMVAGHLVLLAIMGMGVVAAESLGVTQWSLVAVISVLGSAAISMLELMVAFLQAYIFTFLSALFIGAAVHHH